MVAVKRVPTHITAVDMGEIQAEIYSVPRH